MKINIHSHVVPRQLNGKAGYYGPIRDHYRRMDCVDGFAYVDELYLSWRNAAQLSRIDVPAKEKGHSSGVST